MNTVIHIFYLRFHHILVLILNYRSCNFIYQLITKDIRAVAFLDFTAQYSCAQLAEVAENPKKSKQKLKSLWLKKRY